MIISKMHKMAVASSTQWATCNINVCTQRWIVVCTVNVNKGNSKSRDGVYSIA